VSANGGGRFKLSCSSLGPCVGKYKILLGRIAEESAAEAGGKRAKKVVLASGRYSVPAGSKATQVSFKLSAKAKALLRKHGGQMRATLDLLPDHGEPLLGPLTLKAAASAAFKMRATASAKTFKVKIVTKTRLCGAAGKFCGTASGTFGKCNVTGTAVPPKRRMTLRLKGGTITATGEIDEEKPPYLLGAFTLKGTGKWKKLKGKGRFKGHGGTNVFTYTGTASL
jgi:hypothetical protein